MKSSKTGREKKWSHFYSPPAPSEPYEPKPTHIEMKWVSLNRFGNETNMSEVLSLSLPEGITTDKLVLRAEGDDQYQDMDVGYYLEIVHPSRMYKRDLALYKKAKAKYDIDIVQHKQDVKDWTAWKKEQDDKALEKQLSDARALLKKHGKL